MQRESAIYDGSERTEQSYGPSLTNHNVQVIDSNALAIVKRISYSYMIVHYVGGNAEIILEMSAVMRDTSSVHWSDVTPESPSFKSRVRTM